MSETLNILINLTFCQPGDFGSTDDERSDFAATNIVEYEKTLTEEKSFWEWVKKRLAKLTADFQSNTEEGA